MKKILLSLALILVASGGNTAQVNPIRNNIRGVAYGTGVGAAPAAVGKPDSNGVMQQPVKLFETLAWSVTPTMVTGSNTISGGSQSNTSWFDTTAYTSLLLQTEFHGGSATVVVETCFTWTQTGIEPTPSAAGTSGNVHTYVVVATVIGSNTVTSVTNLGKITRIRITANQADEMKNCATVSLGCALRTSL